MNRLTDILLNVVLPLLTGTTIYFFNSPAFIRNYLADGLWAYAFVSALLILWNRKIPTGWLLMVLLTFGLFECLQWSGVIGGTADVADVFVYILFGVFAITINPFLKQSPENYEH